MRALDLLFEGIELAGPRQGRGRPRKWVATPAEQASRRLRSRPRLSAELRELTHGWTVDGREPCALDFAASKTEQATTAAKELASVVGPNGSLLKDLAADLRAFVAGRIAWPEVESRVREVRQTLTEQVRLAVRAADIRHVLLAPRARAADGASATSDTGDACGQVARTLAGLPSVTAPEREALARLARQRAEGKRVSSSDRKKALAPLEGMILAAQSLASPMAAVTAVLAEPLPAYYRAGLLAAFNGANTWTKASWNDVRPRVVVGPDGKHPKSVRLEPLRPGVFGGVVQLRKLDPVSARRPAWSRSTRPSVTDQEGLAAALRGLDGLRAGLVLDRTRPDIRVEVAAILSKVEEFVRDGQQLRPLECQGCGGPGGSGLYPAWSVSRRKTCSAACRQAKSERPPEA